MVVLSLAIGLAEQDDFANLPDLQEVPPSQETTPDKRYLSECVHVCVCVERCIIYLTNPLQAVEHLPGSVGNAHHSMDLPQAPGQLQTQRCVAFSHALSFKS